MQGTIIAYPPPYLLYYIHTNDPYGFVPPLIFIRFRSTTYERLYLGFVRGCDYVHDRTFSRNIGARASGHACIIIRNACVRAHTILCARIKIFACSHTIFHTRGVHVCTYAIFHARASTRILTCTYACMCVHARDSASIYARASAIICDSDGFSLCLYVVLSKNKQYKYM